MNLDEYYTQESLGELSHDEIFTIRKMREKRWEEEGQKRHKLHGLTESCNYCIFAMEYLNK